MLSNSGGNEYGGIYGGQAGDQGREWSIVPWYSYPWDCVLRYPDAKVRKKIAQFGRNAANNNEVGYNQLKRTTFWGALSKVKGYDPANITVACDADCSAGVSGIVKAVGYVLNIKKLKDINPFLCTWDIRKAFRDAGFEVLTAAKYLTSPNYLLEGDILLSDNNHVCINLDNGAYAGGGSTAPSVPAEKPVTTSLVFTYAVRAGGKTYAEVKNLNDYAGSVGKKITDIAIKCNKGNLRYRVHVLGGGWLPWVTGYNWNDYNNGYAGNGKPIDCVQVVLSNAGNQVAQYRVSPMRKNYYSWQYNIQTGNGQDGYAGSYGVAIDRFQVF